MSDWPSHPRPVFNWRTFLTEVLVLCCILAIVYACNDPAAVHLFPRETHHVR